MWPLRSSCEHVHGDCSLRVEISTDLPASRGQKLMEALLRTFGGGGASKGRVQCPN